MGIASYRINGEGCGQLVILGEGVMESLKIYFSDLNEEAQKEVLEFYGVNSPEELNFEIVPLVELEKAD